MSGEPSTTLTTAFLKEWGRAMDKLSLASLAYVEVREGEPSSVLVRQRYQEMREAARRVIEIEQRERVAP